MSPNEPLRLTLRLFFRVPRVSAVNPLLLPLLPNVTFGGRPSCRMMLKCEDTQIRSTRVRPDRRRNCLRDTLIGAQDQSRPLGNKSHEPMEDSLVLKMSVRNKRYTEQAQRRSATAPESVRTVEPFHLRTSMFQDKWQSSGEQSWNSWAVACEWATVEEQVCTLQVVAKRLRRRPQIVIV